MNVNTVITAFVSLGKKINEEIIGNDDLLRKAYYHNRWFTVENTVKSLEAIVKCYLSEEKLKHWLNVYSINIHEPKRIGIVMAGNLPLVGFHDLLCVLASGNIAVIKLSSKDKILLPEIITLLIAIQPEFKDRIIYAEMLKDIDAIIATGGNNAARYFDYYFGKYPNIIRKNRNSIAVLTGNETNEQLLALGNDVFQYFGLGCRNVSKLYLNEEGQLHTFLDAIGTVSSVADHHKYINNYDYNKSIYLVNREPHLDNGFLLLKKSESLVSPIAVLYYDTYKDSAELTSMLERDAEKIQCVVSDKGWYSGSVPFGEAQCPGLRDYADHVDTLSFLLHL
jgi:hypothetical protein